MVRPGSFSFALLLLILCALAFGCAPKKLQPNSSVAFDVPSKLSILKKGSNVLLVSLEKTGYDDRRFLGELARQLNESGYFRVVTKGQARYVMNVNAFMDYRADSSSDAPYNARYVKEQKNNPDGSGYEYIARIDRASSAAAMIATVSIYECETLEPLAYFNVMGSLSDWQAAGSAPAPAQVLENDLSERIVATIRRLLTRERKSVGVIIPSSGDSQAKGLLTQGSPKEAEARLDTLLPDVRLAELRPAMYEAWEEQGVEREMDEDLANYYLKLMCMESRGVTEESVRVIHDGYTRVLILTEDKGLADAAIHSLARVEENARRINIPLAPQ